MRRVSAGRIGMSATVAVLMAALGIAACGEDNPFQVIEELEFDPSLGIDLATMEQTLNGVYYEDRVVGMGDDTVELNSYAYLDHSGWLANGTLFSSGTFSRTVTPDSLIGGFVEGIVGMVEGGTRLLIIPPALAYGTSGNSVIPPGSVLVFEVVVDSIQ